MTTVLVSQHEAAGFLTLAEAAKLAGRSYSWARERAIDGRLARRHFGPGRIAYVTTESLARVIEREKRIADAQAHVARMRRRSHLRLVVDNT